MGQKTVAKSSSCLPLASVPYWHPYLVPVLTSKPTPSIHQYHSLPGKRFLLVKTSREIKELLETSPELAFHMPEYVFSNNRCIKIAECADDSWNRVLKTSGVLSRKYEFRNIWKHILIWILITDEIIISETPLISCQRCCDLCKVGCALI